MGIPAVHEFRVPVRAFEFESQPPGNGAALRVAGGAADLDPVQIHFAEQMGDGRAARVGDDTAALKLAGQPVAQLHAAVAPVYAVSPDHPGDPLAMPDAGGKAL